MPKDQATKPKKTYAEFPLTARANGQWCKKIRGKVHFFGVWAEADTAIQKYLDERDDLQAGRIPQRLSSDRDDLPPDGDRRQGGAWLARCGGGTVAAAFPVHRTIWGVACGEADEREIERPAKRSASRADGQSASPGAQGHALAVGP